MRHASITIAIPFEDARSSIVESYARALGNPASAAVRSMLDATALVHFMSIFIVRGDARTKAHIIVEISADGSEQTALEKLSADMAGPLEELLRLAGAPPRHAGLCSFLGQYRLSLGLGWRAVPGLVHEGSPGMTIARIRQEAKLAVRIADILAEAPPFDSALKTLEHVRRELWTEDCDKWAFTPEGAACLDAAPSPGARAAMTMLRSAISDFLWPLLLLPVAAFALSLLSTGFWSACGLAALALGAEAAATVAAYFHLRHKESTDIVDDLPASAGLLSRAMECENRIGQNHLAAISLMKPGALRRLTLRLGLWVTRQLAEHFSRPGFVNEIEGIHFARWVLLPGTDRLLFMSNYDGSWEYYIGDFIDKAHEGVTGIWSNTRGFPRTERLLFQGAEDGDRMRRWARRQQCPTLFWYPAYPDLTTERIRTNAAIRRAVAVASTETEAAEWLACFGRSPRPRTTLEIPDISSLTFETLSSFPHSHCLLLKLADDRDSCRDWIRAIEPSLAYGDTAKSSTALVAAFSAPGLRKLGLKQDQLSGFPIAFQQGMTAAWRSLALGDRGPHAPEQWWWGGPNTPDIDAVLLIYAADGPALARCCSERRADAIRVGHEIVQDIRMAPLPEDGKPMKEPFGFVEGVSQPIIRGTRRAQLLEPGDRLLHLIEPGEIILGYADNRGYIPPSPSVPASEDPGRLLPPLAGLSQPSSSLRDLGRNGTFLVVRQLEQDIASFEAFLDDAADSLANNPRVPRNEKPWLREWVAAKMMGRWRDGTSLVRYPHSPGSSSGGSNHPLDNEFLLGLEDPDGIRCPFGAHIRRMNPRDSKLPGAEEELAIINRHRMLRVGRRYEPATESSKPGMLFMCLNADIERQFEFVQQNWALSPSFHGLDAEVDPILGHGGASRVLTVPTEHGPLRLKDVRDFVTVRGGGYFFLPGRITMRFLGREGSETRHERSCSF
jgi:deferrochelatase/peroxidase EfeB